MECNFTYKETKDGIKLYECSKCEYITEIENSRRECKPIPQPQYGEPSILKKIGNFTFALAKHLYKGMPTVSKDVLDDRLKICQECPLFKKKEGMVGGVCTHESCGCSVQDEIVFLNKIAWADQKCPLEKWGEINEK
jgi:hypothetical protein